MQSDEAWRYSSVSIYLFLYPCETVPNKVDTEDEKWATAARKKVLNPLRWASLSRCSLRGWRTHPQGADREKATCS